MALTLITGPANAGKARVVLERLRGHLARGEMPLLVVPTGADADFYRRELAERGPVSGAEVCLFSGLLERIARAAAQRDAQLGVVPLGRVASRCALTTIVGEVWAKLPQGGTEAPPDEPVRVTAGVVDAVVEAVAELRLAAADPGRLREALARAGTASGGGPAEGQRLGLAEGQRLGLAEGQRLLNVYERYVTALSSAGRLDGESRARRAMDVLRRFPDAWGAVPVLLYGFDDLTAVQLDAVVTLSRAVDAPVTVSLPYEPGRLAFVGRAWAMHQLAPMAREHIERRARPEYYAPGSRAVLHRLERSLFDSVAEAAASGEAAVSEAAIASAGDVPGVALAPGEGVDGCGSGSGGAVCLLEGRTEREEVELVAGRVRALIDAGMAGEQIAIVHRSPASVAELVDEVLGGLGIRHQSARRVPFHHTSLGAALIGMLRCATMAEEGEGGATTADMLAWLRAPGVLERPELADRLEAKTLSLGVRDAATARRIWESEKWPLDRLERMGEAAAEGPAALIERAERELAWLFAAPRRRKAAVLAGLEAEQAEAFRAGMKVLGELGELAACAPELVGGAQGVVDALCDAALAGPEPNLEGGVLVVDPLSLRARRVRALFLCGMQDGVFPAPARPEPISAQLRRRYGPDLLGFGGGVRRDQLALERYLLYATISRPEELLCISWHAASDEGAVTPRSPFVDDVCDLLPSGLLPVQGGPGVDGVLPRSDLAPARGGGAAGRYPALIQELSHRSTWSASSLERWAACPVSWFVDRDLRPQELRPKPEPMARGGLAHAVLRDVMVALKESAGSARITAASLKLALQLLRQSIERHLAEMPLSVSDERGRPARRRLEADLERYLAYCAEHPSPLEPTHFELPFGMGDEGELGPLDLGGGILIRGRIDRVDVGPSGEAVIYDYKSGNVGPSFARSKWKSDRKFQAALYMLAVSRLLGYVALGGLYQPLGAKDLRPRGAVAGEVGLDQEGCVKTDLCSAEEVCELVAEIAEQALAAAKEARQGLIEPRPERCTPGGKCAYPGICRCEP